MLKLRLPVPRFVSSGELFFEKGAIGVLRALPATRIALIVSGSLWRHPEACSAVTKAIGKTDFRVFPAPRGEPDLDRLQPLIAEVSEYRPDWLVAVGGGSVLDSAKLVWAFYEHPDLDLERALRPGGMPSLRGKARFAAVPTTSGTGSEVSSAAVFSDPETGTKRALVSHDLLPDLAVLDPELVRFAPAGVTAAGGLDALSHAVEGYVSRLQNPFLDRQAELVASIVLRSLETCVRGPDDRIARMDLMSASLMAGWVQNAKVPGIGHALAHQMGRFDIPHGHACGIFLPISIEINSEDPAVREKYGVLAGRLGLSSARDLATRCRDLMSAVGLESRLSKLAPTLRSAADRVVEGAAADVCARANPVPLTAGLLGKALEMAG